MEVKYEKGRLEDLDEIELLVNKAVKKMRNGGNTQWGDSYPIRKNFEEDLCRNQLYKAIDEEGCIVGIATMNEEESPEYKTISWGKDDKAFVLHRLIIHPEAQGKGIGRKLTAYFEEVALGNGYHYLKLDAYSLNEAANGLYKSFGYTNRGQVYFRGLEAPFICYDKILIK